MLTYNPRCHTEFLQFIPRFKNLGQIQHIYLTDLTTEGEQHDGVTMETLLLGDIQSMKLESVQDAVHDCGGMAVLLYLHSLVCSIYNGTYCI